MPSARYPAMAITNMYFPQKRTRAFRGNFKKPHAWDLGKRFRRVAEAVGIKELRIHDLRHFTASTLTAEGVADNIISLLTGHKSRELRRYQHLREDLKRGTVDLLVSADIKHPQNCRFCRWESPLGESARHTNAAARDVGERGRVWELRDDGQPSWLADRRPSRAVSRNRSIGMP